MQSKDIENTKNDSDGEVTMVNNTEMRCANEDKIGNKKILESQVDAKHDSKTSKHLDVPKKRHNENITHLQRRKLRKIDGKIHKEYQRSNKSSTALKKVAQLENEKSDSFYSGAIVGSFLGAAISTVLTKILTDGL